MTFTYDPSLSTDLAKVRAAIGDTSDAANAGVKPDGTNFSDDELNLYINTAGSWQKAVPMVLRVLANMYAAKARSVRIGDYAEDLRQTAANLRAQAEEWEKGVGAVWTGLISWRDTDDEGDEIGHMFGMKQWGADPEDYGS